MKYDNEDQSSNYKVIRASCHNQLMDVSLFVIQHTTLLCFCYIKLRQLYGKNTLVYIPIYVYCICRTTHKTTFNLRYDYLYTPI